MACETYLSSRQPTGRVGGAYTKVYAMVLTFPVNSELGEPNAQDQAYSPHGP